MNAKKYTILTVILSALLFAGCAKDDELTVFRDKFEEFCNNVSTIDTSINSIDADSEEAPGELLSLLDELETEFQELAALDVPEEFEYMESLADEASENMSLAVENYHTAFKSETHDSYAASIAAQYYERAYKRIQYMITFMHGEIPDDENVSVEIEE